MCDMEVKNMVKFEVWGYNDTVARKINVRVHSTPGLMGGGGCRPTPFNALHYNYTDARCFDTAYFAKDLTY